MICKILITLHTQHTHTQEAQDAIHFSVRRINIQDVYRGFSNSADPMVYLSNWVEQQTALELQGDN